MRVLVTNDDGFDAPGLAVLARAMMKAGHDVVVVAPLTEASGAGAGVGPLHVMGRGIPVEAVAPPGLEGIKVLAADALPALIVLTACLGAFGPPPELVAAGINPGRNVGSRRSPLGHRGCGPDIGPFRPEGPRGEHAGWGGTVRFRVCQ